MMQLNQLGNKENSGCENVEDQGIGDISTVEELLDHRCKKYEAGIIGSSAQRVGCLKPRLIEVVPLLLMTNLSSWVWWSREWRERQNLFEESKSTGSECIIQNARNHG